MKGILCSGLTMLAITIAASNFAYAQAPGFRVINTFHIASGGRWDYIAVSPVTDNIYVSHQTQVNILNIKYR